MARGRPWTPEEDALVVEAAALRGRYDPARPYDQRWTVKRLHDVAERIDRTPAAVHKRAQRIAERSYTRFEE